METFWYWLTQVHLEMAIKMERGRETPCPQKVSQSFFATTLKIVTKISIKFGG